ncbi:IPT/TIG domain-containing protein [Echinicola sp. CAU 1574]|uniref:IPT/TIG domain-containing protein n=1 Tax=Echinicola arenosa TaxID=2774144 RepID=A0ABR9ANF5_9BACT|nr:IPT/TIG domain-containing protein [Echinicola arenosa]MBD8489154.1 IPT/TIG domain-containing protein [Echinicola arenosa]
MKYINFLLLTFVVLSVWSCTEEDSSPVPDKQAFVYTMRPQEGYINDVVIISGRGFSPVRENNEVMFNGNSATVLEASNDQLQVVVPEGEGVTNLTVSINGETAAGADLSFNFIQAPEEYIVSSLAGNSEYGLTDGLGTNAFFRNPEGVAKHPGGYLIITDRTNNAIRKVDMEGNVSTILGTGNKGFQNGPVAIATLDYPWKSCVDKDGNIYVADRDNHAIRKIDVDGNVSTLAGTGTAGYQDGPGTTAQFNQPIDVTVDENGIIYVADNINHRIRKIDTEGTVSTLAGSGEKGYQDGALSAAMFSNPSGLDMDNEGNIIVADRINHLIRRINLSTEKVSTIAGSSQGSRDGLAEEAQFNNPYGVAVGASGEIVVADLSNHKIRLVKDGEVSTIGGTVSGFLDGPNIIAQFYNPTDVEVLNEIVYVADLGNHRIRKIEKK